MAYTFQTNEFGISDNGIHLLRSGFNYRTIDFSEIKSLQIEKGKELHNWWLIFIIGTALLTWGIYLSVWVINSLIQGNVGSRFARVILLILIPLGGGGYFVYNSLRTGLILKITCSSGSKEIFPLKEMVKNKELAEFKTYLSGRIGPGIQ